MPSRPNPPDIEQTRADIDELDATLVTILLARFRLLDRLAAIKVRDELEPVDVAREREVAAKVYEAARYSSPAVRAAIADVHALVVQHSREELRRLIREHQARRATIPRR